VNIGLTENEWGDLTQHQSGIYIEAWTQKARDEVREDMLIAWHIAALPRLKRFPTLRGFLRPFQEAEPEEIDEARAFHKRQEARLNGG
jgi:hypothetical protein